MEGVLEEGSSPVKITPRAREAIAKLLRSGDDSAGSVLRLYMVKEGYQLKPHCALDSNIDPEDSQYDFKDFMIVIDPISKIYLGGMQLDLVDGKIVFSNYDPSSFSTDAKCETCGI